jgi:hypothetical protein
MNRLIADDQWSFTLLSGVNPPLTVIEEGLSVPSVSWLRKSQITARDVA